MEAFNPIPLSILEWMEATWLNSLMLDWAWSWVVAETIHFTGMCLLYGPIIMMDLRLVGLARKRMSASSVHVLVPVALTGFAINLITGILFLFGLPFRYAMNISFQIKMVLLFLAGINVLYFWRRASEVLTTGGASDQVPLESRFIGLTSLLLWTGVIIFGRMMPYLGTG